MARSNFSTLHRSRARAFAPASQRGDAGNRTPTHHGRDFNASRAAETRRRRDRGSLGGFGTSTRRSHFNRTEANATSGSGGIDPNHVPIVNPGFGPGSTYSHSTSTSIKDNDDVPMADANSAVSSNANFPNANQDGKQEGAKPRQDPKPNPKPGGTRPTPRQRYLNKYRGTDEIKRLVTNKKLRAILAGRRLPQERKKARDLELRMSGRKA